MDFVINRNFDKVIVKMEGKLEQEQSDVFVQEIEKHLVPAVREVILDFQLCAFVSSYGVFVLNDLKKKLEETQREMKIINVPEHIKKIFLLLDFLH